MQQEHQQHQSELPKGLEYHLIVAFDKKFGIGKDDEIPWSIPEDLAHFKKMTEGSIVVMGKTTYFSIPEDKRPLRRRMNVVLTSKPWEHSVGVNVVFVTETELYDFLNAQKTKYSKCFFIGGESVYDKYIDTVDHLHITHIDSDFDCDKFFPTYHLQDFQLKAFSNLHKASRHNNCTYRFLEYQRISQPTKQHSDDVYLNLLKDILTNGEEHEDRTGTGTLSVFGRQLRFDISRTVPLLTTKFIPWKSVIKELIWFLKGDTDANHLKEQGVGIWNGNSSREFLDKRGLPSYQEGDIGPMYGWQWRHSGAEYQGASQSYDGQGIDQLEQVIQLLKTDPFSRRIIMTTYNVGDLEKGVLHPCHGLVVQFYVSKGSNGELHLSTHMYQRSVDTFLGLTWNIFSYAVLTHIIAKYVGMYPKELIISTGDTHLYKDHLEQSNLQLTRHVMPSPTLVVKDDIKNKSISDLTIDDFEIVGYFHHPAIKANMSV